jgi:hypothetical protein
MFVSLQAPLLAKNARNGAPSSVLRVQVYSCSEQEVGHPAGGHNAFYNLGLGVAAGPTQGFGPLLGRSIEGTPWASGPVDVLTNAFVNRAGSLITGSGETIQTLDDAVELGSVLSTTGEVAEYATGFGEVKLGYDFLTWAGSVAGCGMGILQ